MEQTLEKIAKIAENLGNKNLVNGRVSLKKILKSKKITLVYGHYKNHFLGLLAYSSRKFYIYINLDLLPDKKSTRTRFTIAHELGHFFIDSHRINLKNGISLTENENFENEFCKKMERKADYFASHLLMPRKNFVDLAKKYEPGLKAILRLSKKYDTSIESATIHYINLNLSNCIMIKWNSNLDFHYSSYSKSFSEMTGLRTSPPIKYEAEYIKEIVNTIIEGDYEFYETVTNLSKWLSIINPGASNDILGIEQTLKLGDFGGITFLLFNQSSNNQKN